MQTFFSLLKKTIETICFHYLDSGLQCSELVTLKNVLLIVELLTK